METEPLADLLGALSLATDAAAGLPPETSLRICVVAGWIGRKLGLPAAELREVHWTTLLRHLGCTSFSHEAAAIAAGDDHDLLRTFEGSDRRAPSTIVRRAVRDLARGKKPLERARAVLAVLTTPSAGLALARAQCSQARTLAADLGLDEGVQEALDQIYERWDGEGPSGLAGDAIRRSARILHVAQTFETFARRGDVASAIETVRSRSGTLLDPEITRVLVELGGEADRLLASSDLWDRFLAGEGSEARVATALDVDHVAVVFGNYADLKIPSRLGHSGSVARLAADGARALGVTAAEVRRVERAAHLHDLGIVATPNSVWEPRGALGVGAWELVRLHAYQSERILARSHALAELGPLVGAHHERLDGSGYHRGTRGAGLDRLTRVLSAADVLAALRSPRPHRAAYSDNEASRLLRTMVDAGCLCRTAVDAVLAGASGGAPRVDRHPAGLTEREVEVLVHAARGSSNKEIASVLQISTRTVKHHLEHVYEKTGARTRAAAALFAVRNGLVTL